MTQWWSSTLLADRLMVKPNDGNKMEEKEREVVEEKR